MKRAMVATTALVGAFAMAGCAGMSYTQQRTLSGAGIGTAVGVGVGAITGEWACAAAGAAIGAASGYLYDQQKKREEEAYRRGIEEGKQPPPR